MGKEKAVVLCSGGMNSAVVASIAAREHSVALLHVRFGHRAAEREAALFARQADFFEIRERLVIDMPHFAAIGGNARVDRKKAIEDARATGEQESNCYVPGLIGTLAGAAFTWAWTIGASRVLVGVAEQLVTSGPRTAELFPDYARDYVQLLNHLYAVAGPRRNIGIEAPLIDLSRAEIVRLGQRLGTPFHLTWSCLSSGTTFCGGCPGCATRQRGFLDAGIPDPVVLEDSRREPAARSVAAGAASHPF